MTTTGKIVRGSAAAMVIGLALTGCAGSTDSSNGGAAAPVLDTVAVQIAGAPVNLDPAAGSTIYDSAVHSALYDTLVVRDGDTVIAGLASEWDVTPNSVAFTIRQDIVCADGTELTAQHVADSLTRYFAPETAAPLAGAISGGSALEIAAEGDVVTVTASRDYADLLPGFTLPATGIVCPAGLEDPSVLATEAHGTGPFVMADQVVGSSYTLTARDDYAWLPAYADQPAGERPETLVVKVVSDAGTAANLLETGELQIADFTGEEWKRFENTGFTLTPTAQALSFLMLNHLDGTATTDVDVRKAIMQAVDRERVNEIQSFGAGELLDNIGEASYRCYDASMADLIPATDAAAAAGVLDGVSLRILGTTDSQVGDYLLNVLTEAGADVTLDNQAPGDWATTLFTKSDSWDVSVLKFLNIAGSIAYTGAYFSGPAVPSGQNLSSIANSEADELLTSSHSFEGDEQCAAVSAFQRTLFENYSVLPLATVPTTVVTAAGVAALTDQGAIIPATITVGGE